MSRRRLLCSYRRVQRGPSFLETIDASIDRESARYEVRYRADPDADEEIVSARSPYRPTSPTRCFRS